MGFCQQVVAVADFTGQAEDVAGQGRVCARAGGERLYHDGNFPEAVSPVEKGRDGQAKCRAAKDQKSQDLGM